MGVWVGPPASSQPASQPATRPTRATHLVQRTSQGDALLLPARQVDPLLANLRVRTRGQHLLFRVIAAVTLHQRVNLGFFGLSMACASLPLHDIPLPLSHHYQGH